MCSSRLLTDSVVIQHINKTGILKYKWHVPHANNIAKSPKIKLSGERVKYTCKHFASNILWTKHPTLPFFIRISKRNWGLSCVSDLTKKALQRWTFHWNRKTIFKQEKLMSLKYSQDIRPYLLVLQQNSDQSKGKVGCHSLHQLNAKPTAKASLESFLLSTTN